MFWIGCTPETNGLHPDPEPFLSEPEPIPVEVPFQIWMKSHFHHNEPFRFWIETKAPLLLQFQIFPCLEGPFAPGIKKMVAQHQQFFSAGRQSVSMNPPVSEEGAYLLKVMNWEWLGYIPFSYSSVKPHWYLQDDKTQVVFFPPPSSPQVLLKNKIGTLSSGSLLTHPPLYLPEPPCYLDFGKHPSLPKIDPPLQTSLPTSPTLRQLSQPGIRYQSLVGPKILSAPNSPFLAGTLDTFFLDRPGSVKLQLQRYSPSVETLPNTRITLILKALQDSEKEVLLGHYPFQGDLFREEILVPTRGCHQLKIKMDSIQITFPLWVESGTLPIETTLEGRFFAQRLSDQEAIVFLQSGYPGNFLLNLNGEQSFPLFLDRSGFRVLRVPLPKNVASLTLFSPFSEPKTVSLPTITNLSQKLSGDLYVWRFPPDETDPWTLPVWDFQGLSFSPGWSRTLSSEIPWKNHLPYPKKNEEFREKYQNGVLLESSSLMEKSSYARAVESLRQARIVLPKQDTLEKLHLSALENLLTEHQMQHLMSQKLTLSAQDQPLQDLLRQISIQTGIPVESNAPFEKIHFSCQQKPLLEVLAQVSMERDLQIQVDFGTLSFQRRMSVIEFPVSAFNEQTLFQPASSFAGPISYNLSSTPEFFISAQPQTLFYGFVCKLLQ